MRRGTAPEDRNAEMLNQLQKTESTNSRAPGENSQQDLGCPVVVQVYCWDLALQSGERHGGRTVPAMNNLEMIRHVLPCEHANVPLRGPSAL
jgi:hypothetical protein